MYINKNIYLLFRAKLDLAAKTANFTEYIEVLEISHRTGSFKKPIIQKKIFHIFFIFDINKLFEHPDTFKKMNQRHSDFYKRYNYAFDLLDMKNYGVGIDFV